MIFVPASDALRMERPLFRSRVPAGLPASAEDHVDGSLDLDEHLIEHRESTYFIRLLPENPCFRPIEFGDGQERSIWGVATSVVHRLK